MDKDSLQLLLSQGLSVEQIGRRFGKHPSTISYWMRKHELVAPNREKYAAKGGIDREHLEKLVKAGMSIARIADETGRSDGTVRHWLRKYDLTTSHASRRWSRSAANGARAAGMLVITMSCPVHGETDYIIQGRGYYRCRLCRQESVVRRRRQVKLILVAEAGGRCALCGYDRYVGALQFHHRDRSEKRFSLSGRGLGRSLAAARAEARKCVLLCSNCHAEAEAGLVSAPE